MAIRTETEIQAELDSVNEAILILLGKIKEDKGVSSFSVAGRQVVTTESLDLERLRAFRKELERELVRVQAGGGIRTRYGVPR